MNKYHNGKKGLVRPQILVFFLSCVLVSVAIVSLFVVHELKQNERHIDASQEYSKSVKALSRNQDVVTRPTTRPVKSPLITPDVIDKTVGDALIPVYYKINTTKPVVFLGIDDGLVKNEAGLQYMKENNIRAMLFLNDATIKDNYGYFQKILDNGSIIENHTVDHSDLTKLTYEQAKKEICDEADRMLVVYGHRPTLFRPPYGAFNDDTRRAAEACGMKAVIHWHAKANGGSMQYQQGNKLLPGDIVLMHFRPMMLEDLKAFKKAVDDAGLQIQLLEDWL